MTDRRTLEQCLDPARSALVLWDLQVGLAGAASNREQLAVQVPRLIAGARAAGCRVVWSRHVGLPVDQMSPALRRIQARAQGAADATRFMPPGSPEGEWVDWARPDTTDLVLEKSHPTFFAGTGLDVLLRAWSVDTLVLAGVATDHGIDLTARHGLSLGFTSVVVPDATGSFTDEAHTGAIDRLAGMAEVLAVDAVLDVWSSTDRT